VWNSPLPSARRRQCVRERRRATAAECHRGPETDPTRWHAQPVPRPGGEPEHMRRGPSKSLAAPTCQPHTLPLPPRAPPASGNDETGPRASARSQEPDANHRSASPTLNILSPLAFQSQPDSKNLAVRQVLRSPVPTLGFPRCPPRPDLPPSSIATTPEINLGHPRPLPGPFRPAQIAKLRNPRITVQLCHFGRLPTAGNPPTKVRNLFCPR